MLRGLPHVNERGEMSHTSYFDLIGGPAVVRSAITILYDRVLADPELAPFFEGMDMNQLRAHQRAFFTSALDGPQVYTGRDLGEAHAHLAITDAAFDRILKHVLDTLADLEVDPGASAAVDQKLQSLRPVIVTTH